jgi:division protein CdvB (Snf7/Vps24/ESCRT-III family)
MTTEITRGEFSQLEARVAIVEREVEGEKMVTRHILEQTRRNSDDLATIKSRLVRVETRLDGVESRLDRVESRLDRVEQKLDGFIRDFPAMVAQTMRDVLRERDAG